MSCCGNKRKEYLNEARSLTRQNNVEDVSRPPVADKPERVFEYTGNYSLTIYGAVSGKSYNFKFKGDKLTVDYNDSFAMLAERDLKAAAPVYAESPVSRISEHQSHDRMR
jgi:hypothetical protein